MTYELHIKGSKKLKWEEWGFALSPQSSKHHFLGLVIRGLPGERRRPGSLTGGGLLCPWPPVTAERPRVPPRIHVRPPKSGRRRGSKAHFF